MKKPKLTEIGLDYAAQTSPSHHNFFSVHCIFEFTSTSSCRVAGDRDPSRLELVSQFGSESALRSVHQNRHNFVTRTTFRLHEYSKRSRWSWTSKKYSLCMLGALEGLHHRPVIGLLCPNFRTWFIGIFHTGNRNYWPFIETPIWVILYALESLSQYTSLGNISKNCDFSSKVA